MLSAFHDDSLILGFRQLRQSDADGKGQQQQREHIAFKKRLYDIIRDETNQMTIVRQLGRISDSLPTLPDSLSRQIARSHQHIESCSHCRCREGCEQCIG